MAAGEGDATALNGAAVLAILRRRKWLLLASIVLCPLLAYVAITQLTPRYTATGTMIYDPSESTVREMQSILRVDPITDAVMATQAEVLHGMPVIEQVTNRLNLLTNPEFNTSLKPPSWPERTLAEISIGAVRFVARSGSLLSGPRLEPARNATLTAVRAALTVTPVKGSRVLEVSFVSEDPVIAAAGGERRDGRLREVTAWGEIRRGRQGA